MHVERVDGCKTSALALVVAVYVGILLVFWVLPLTPVQRLNEALYWNYAGQSLFFVIPLFVLALARRAPADYGLTLCALPRELRVGGICFVVLILAPLLGEGLFGHLTLKHPATGFVASTIVFQLVFSGFGEELLFRGFFQGELNRAFGRPFRWGPIHFGWGLILTAALFAIGHFLNPFNPLEGSYQLDIVAFFMTGVAGLVFGFVREYFGSIIAVAMVHGGWDLVASLCPLSAAGNIAMGLGIFVACWYLATAFAAPRKDTSSAGSA